MSNPPVLDLDTLEPERPQVRIRTASNRDGKFYEVSNLDDLGLADRARLGRLQQTMTELGPAVEAFKAGDIPDDHSIGQLEAALDEFLTLAFRGLEVDVIAAMKLGQKEALIQVFTEASPPEMKARIAEATATLESQSPASSSPTAGTPEFGSTSNPDS